MPADARYEALLREAARDLVDTLEPYRVLPRHRLADLSGERHWGTVGFAEALKWAEEHGLLRSLGRDLYELPGEHTGVKSTNRTVGARPLMRLHACRASRARAGVARVRGDRGYRRCHQSD